MVFVSSISGIGVVVAGKPNEDVLNRYLRVAFAETEKLTKFSLVPSVSVYCVDEACQPVVDRLKEALGGVVDLRQTDSENSGADIEVLLYANTNARLNSNNEYTAVHADEQLGRLVHENCVLVQSRRGFEVVKVLVVATYDSGLRQNLVCVLTEILRGSGITMRGRYPQYIDEYLGLDGGAFATVLKGFSFLLAMHFSTTTKPGQDKATVKSALTDGFNWLE